MKKSFLIVFLICISKVSLSFADQVRLLDNDNLALQARVDLIQNAKSEILVEYYEVANDALSLTGLSLLSQAAERGVKVKILIDSLHNSLTKAQMAAMMSKNLEIKVYNPFHSLNLKNMAYRNHDKLLNVDGNLDHAYMIVGGRNAAKNYFGKDRELNFKDADVLVVGKSANTSYKYFMNLWENNNEVRKVSLGNYGKFNCIAMDDINNCLTQHFEREREIKENRVNIKTYFEHFKQGHSWVKEESILKLTDGIEEVKDVKFYFNDPTLPMKKVDNKLSHQIQNYLLNQTKNSLTIVTPYLFPTEEELKMLETLANRGVSIKIITNSLLSTDVEIVYAAFLTIKKRLVDMGVELYLYKGPETLHAKGAIVDGSVAFIGSFNFDRKSAEINREIGVKIGSKEENQTEFVKEFGQFINKEIIANSILASKDKYEYSLESIDKLVPADKIKKLNRFKKIVKFVKDYI